MPKNGRWDLTRHLKGQYQTKSVSFHGLLRLLITNHPAMEAVLNYLLTATLNKT